MKFILFAVLFLAVSSLARTADRSDEVLDYIKSKQLKEFITEYVDVRDELNRLEEACPGGQEKLKSAIAELNRCNDETDTLTICEYVNRYASNCTRPLISLIDECIIPSKLREWASLASRSIFSVVEYFCGLQGEDMMELFNPCIFDGPSQEQFDECENKMRHQLNLISNNTFPSPSEFCGQREDLNVCLQSSINSSCKNAKTRAFYIGFLRAITVPCSVINEI